VPSVKNNIQPAQPALQTSVFLFWFIISQPDFLKIEDPNAASKDTLQHWSPALIGPNVDEYIEPTPQCETLSRFNPLTVSVLPDDILPV
jgi:hypothetical protein